MTAGVHVHQLAWLGMQNVDAAADLWKPYDAQPMQCYPVSTRINSVANDDEECSRNLRILARPQLRCVACRKSVRCARRFFVGCLLLIVFLAFPRIALALLFLFSNYLERAYHGLILLVLGFLFLPLTTLVYAWMANTRQPIAGINLLILIVTVVIDLGGLSGGEYHRRRRPQD
jgi:hypothetical protein